MAPALITAEANFFCQGHQKHSKARWGVRALSLSVSYQAAILKIKQARKRNGRQELYGRFAPSHSNVGDMKGAKHALEKMTHFDDTEYMDKSIPVI